MGFSPLRAYRNALHIIKQQEQIFREKIYSELTFLRAFEIRCDSEIAPTRKVEDLEHA